jgi:hypothetical protein
MGMFILTSFCGLSSAKSMLDPSSIGMGARPLGLGKAYLAIADDSSAIFLNPAGLGRVKHWMLTSMYTKLLNEIDYTMAGGVYYTPQGGIGIGYVGASIGGSYLTQRNTNTDRIEVTAGSPSMSYSNNVVLLANGVSLGPLWIFKDFNAGLSLKLFNQGITGTGEGTASGYDADIGILASVSPWLNIGLTYVNLLPDSMARLRWATNTTESIPSYLRAGVSAQLLGAEAPFHLWDHYLTADLDLELPGERPSRPTLYHLGLEWWPTDILAIRGGIDQDAVSRGGAVVGVDSNLTAGVGLQYAGFQFDYAYHQYGDLEVNTTHYFSLSYVGIKKRRPLMIDYVALAAPLDKTKTYKDTLEISGQIVNPQVSEIYLNGFEAEISSDGIFKGEVGLALKGKNLVEIVVLGKNGEKLQVSKQRVLKMLSFSDVKSDFWAAKAVEESATLGLIGGFPDNTFKPDNGITRAELAALLVRARGESLPEEVQNIFVDLSPSHWAAKYIIVAKKLNLVGGYPDGTFRPSRGLTRAEAVAIVARFDTLAEPKTISVLPFPDIKETYWAAKIIAAAKDAGYLKYLEGKNFEPDKKLSRAEAVEIFGKSRFVKAKVEELYNWEKGY